MILKNSINHEVETTTTNLNSKITDKNDKKNQINQLVGEINIIQGATIKIQERQSATNQIQSALIEMVLGDNDATAKEAIKKAKAGSSELKDENGIVFNLPASEARNLKKSTEFSMRKSGPAIRRAIKEGKTSVKINGELSAEETLCVIDMGYNVGLEEVQVRNGDDFSTKFIYVIDWSIPNGKENLNDYGLS